MNYTQKSEDFGSGIAKFNLTIDGTEREFQYRKGTADEVIIVQTLQNSAYDVGRTARGGEIIALYKQPVAQGRRPLIIDTAAEIGSSAVLFACKFPNARVVAVEADPAKFALLTANTVDPPIQCIQAAIGVRSSAHSATPCVTVNDICAQAPDSTLLLVKLDVEACDIFTADTEWVARTPVIVAALSDYLVPGTPASRAFVHHAAGWDRDFIYLEDTIFRSAVN